MQEISKPNSLSPNSSSGMLRKTGGGGDDGESEIENAPLLLAGNFKTPTAACCRGSAEAMSCTEFSQAANGKPGSGYWTVFGGCSTAVNHPALNVECRARGEGRGRARGNLIR